MPSALLARRGTSHIAWPSPSYRFRFEGKHALVWISVNTPSPRLAGSFLAGRNMRLIGDANSGSRIV
jgi:hypothetical protein